MVCHPPKVYASRIAWMCGIVIACTVLPIIFSACTVAVDPRKPATEPFPTLPLAKVPDFMKGTIFERVIVSNVVPATAGGYGLVVNLHGTGGCNVPTALRQYMRNKLAFAKLDSDPDSPFAHMSADQILDDKRVTIAQLIGKIPPGARQGQPFDITVKAMPRSGCTSLAGGRLYQAELSERGLASPLAANINVLAAVQSGDIFVNPALAYMTPSLTDTAKLASLTTGYMLNGGMVMSDRPIFMQLREPSGSGVRWMEAVIMQRFPYLSPGVPPDVARAVKAKNEDLLALYTPDQFNGDWEHYLGVVTHLYLRNDDSGFIVAKCKELFAVAHQPDAPLKDISFCWEAMGPDRVSLYNQLITDPNPDIAFAAARAAAFNGDTAAKEALLQMATNGDCPFQLPAVQTLAALPITPEITHMLGTLLNNPRATVRLAAFNVLKDHRSTIFSEVIKHKFVLDIIDGNSTPLIYATRTGVPHIAVFGHGVSLRPPVLFMAMDQRFSISYIPDSPLVNIFYRDPVTNHSYTVTSHNNLAEIIARLAGKPGPDADSTFDFNYTDVLVLLERMNDQHLIVGKPLDGPLDDGAFVMEATGQNGEVLAGLGNDTTIEGSRPQGTAPDTRLTTQESGK